jgi:hypothetical protein
MAGDSTLWSVVALMGGWGRFYHPEGGPQVKRPILGSHQAPPHSQMGWTCEWDLTEPVNYWHVSPNPVSHPRLVWQQFSV